MRKPRQAKIIEALTKSAGNISTAAKILQVSRQSVHAWMKGNKVLQDARAEAFETMLDLAESKLIIAINGGDMTAIIYTLKTQGRTRGWGEHQQITFTKDDVINVGYTDDQDAD